MSVLITTKTFGPLLRMIYLMIVEMAAFLFIYLCIIVSMTAVMTALWHNEVVDYYRNFIISARTLVAACFANFDIIAF